MTGTQLFDIALDLIGLKSASGDAPSDTDDLRARALSLINTVIAENAILDCKIRKTEHTVGSVAALDEELGMSDIVESTVLPYALARLLVIGEDDGLYAEMSKLYETASDRAIRFGRAKIEAITEVYK